MAADQERADRIRQLKKDHPEFTWQEIADRVGVSLRAAQSWQEKGGIDYENAKKLAALLDEDLDFIMRGTQPEPPALMDALSGQPQLEQIERHLAALNRKLDEILTKLDESERGTTPGVDIQRTTEIVTETVRETMQALATQTKSPPRSRKTSSEPAKTD